MFKEWIGLAKLLSAAALAITLTVGGCRYGEGKGEAARAALEERVSTLQAANAGFAAIEERRKEEVKLAKSRADEWKRDSEDARKALAEANKAKAIADKKAKEALAKANKDPGCAELLRREVCSVVPLP